MTMQGPFGPGRISSTLTTFGWPFSRNIASTSRKARCHTGDASETSRSSLIATVPPVEMRVVYAETLIRLAEGESLQAVERGDASLDDEDDATVAGTTDQSSDAAGAEPTPQA